ncbi:MAG TPA: SMI1/KNR4 family protein [Bryobacteraceae bacterium]|nr:SMI1/KNR4 family protein [Bryobacteraceae bacterium]
MTEVELTVKIKEFANDRQRRFAMARKRRPATLAASKALELSEHHNASTRPGKRLHEIGKIYPPVTWEMVRAVEDRLGFALPTLLGRLWVEVGNGGFGPGYGLFGLDGGHVEENSRLTLPDLYFYTIEDPDLLLEPVDEDAQLSWNPPPWDPWPKKLVPICNWGCGNESAIDCSTPEGEVIDLLDGIKRFFRESTFAQWMEDWVNGVNLWDHL